MANDILWINEGPGDNFDNCFPDPDKARAIVHQAISDWKTVISDLGGLYLPSFPSITYVPAFFYQLSISATDLSGDLRGQSTPLQVDLTGKPFTGSVQLDKDADGQGWYFDDHPENDSEFSDVESMFAAIKPNTDGYDFYRTVTHEIGHALGILDTDFLAIHGKLSDTNVDDPKDNKGAKLKTFTGDNITATFTTAGGGHIYEGPSVSGLPAHPNDVMNDGRAADPGERMVISDLDAAILHDAYGYTVNYPSTMAGMNFAAVFNNVTGKLTLNGDLLDSEQDHITISRVGQFIDVNVIGYNWIYDINSISNIEVRPGRGNNQITLALAGGNPLEHANLSITGDPAGFTTLNILGSSLDESFTLTDHQIQFTSGSPGSIDFTNTQTISIETAGGLDTLLVKDTPQDLKQVTLDTGAGNDTIAIESSAFTTHIDVAAGLGDDQITLGAGGAGLDHLAGATQIDGDDDTDTLLIQDTNVSHAVDYTLDGNAVIRTGTGDIHFSTLEQLTVQASSFADSLHVEHMPLVVSTHFDGGDGSDTLAGPDSPNVWHLKGPNSGDLNDTFFYQSVENLVGGSVEDRFIITRFGSLTGTVDGGGFALRDDRPFGNMLDYSQDVGPITVNLQTAAATQLGGFANIDELAGSPRPDTLIGPDTTNVWMITNLNAGNVNSQLTFTGIENLTGGNTQDDFLFQNAKGVTGIIDGSAGYDSLDYSAYQTPVTVNLVSHTATGTASFAGMERMYGGSASDTLIGPSVFGTTNLWFIQFADSGLLQSSSNFDFRQTENLVGGQFDDRFIFSVGGSLSGKIDGGGGNDQLDFSFWSQPVTVDLTNLSATAVGSFASIERFIGGTGSDKLIGPNSPNQWMITGVNLGQVNTMAFGNLSFNSIENLQGGPSTDVFQFTMTALMEGNVTGGSGNDQLDYSQFATGIRVNLLQGKASRINGTIAAIENATGGSGNDILVGNALPNVLTGNAGRDLIIGGNGSDTLSGGAGDDLIIGGQTVYDLNQQALAAIMAEWSSNSSYSVRRHHLLGTPGGLNGGYKLNNVTVQNDFAPDAITGGDQMDWFWANVNELLQPVAPGEKIGTN